MTQLAAATGDDDDDVTASGDEVVELGSLELDSAPVREGPPRPVERTRAVLAYLLFGLLAALLAVTLTFLGFGVLTVDEFTDVMSILLAPVVGLLGAATGYYYGRGDR